MIDEYKRLIGDSLEKVLSNVTSASFSWGNAGVCAGRRASFVSFQTLVQVLGVLGALVTGVYSQSLIRM